MSDSARLSVNISDETSATLRSLAAQEGGTVTDIVRRAVAVYKYLDDAQARGDTVRLREQRSGDVTTLRLL